MLSELSQSSILQANKYRVVQDLVTQGVRNRIHHAGLASDIANSVLLSFVREDDEVVNLQSWVANKIEKYTETHISDLWQYCYSYALMLLKNEDNAQEISQTVMIALLQSQQPITYIKGWLKSAVNNRAMSYLTSLSKEDTFVKTLINESKYSPDNNLPDDSDIETKLSPKEIKKFLGKEEYQILCDMNRHPTVKSYANALGISYRKARETKHRILTNLKAAYLKKDGWMDSPEILDYRQLTNIKRFLDTILGYAVSGDFSRVYHYANKSLLPSLEESFRAFREITDWGIHMNPDGSFDVTIIDLSDLEEPTTISMIITLNKANYIRIISCKNLALMAVIPEEFIGRVPSVKGRCPLTLEQIKSYL
jgi:hypothetical protein